MNWNRFQNLVSEQIRDFKSFWQDRLEELMEDGLDIRNTFKTFYRRNPWFQGTFQGFGILAIVAVLDWWFGHPQAARMAYMAPMFLATQRGGKFAGCLVIAASLLALTLSNYHIPADQRNTILIEGLLSLTVMLVGLGLVDRTRESLNKVRHAATHDALTGAANRIGFDVFAEEILSDAVQDDTAVTVVLVDCDNFKRLNDQFGHRAGDDVLISLVKLLKKAVGRDGCVGRTGGDEFVLVIPRRRRLTVQRLMEDVRERFESVVADLGTPTSFSFGISEYRDDGLSMACLLDVADKDMYRYKADRKQGAYALADVS